MTELPPLATIPEVAAFLRVTPRIIRDLTNRGKLACIKIGGTKIIKREQVEEYIEEATCQKSQKDRISDGGVRGAGTLSTTREENGLSLQRAQMTVQSLKRHSRNTSSINQVEESGRVIPMRGA